MYSSKKLLVFQERGRESEKCKELDFVDFIDDTNMSRRERMEKIKKRKPKPVVWQCHSCQA